MAELLFRLRGVPEDEAEEIRALLLEHAIDFYETEADNWGVSMPAIWLANAHQFHEAKSLIETYQQQRSVRIRSEIMTFGQAGILWGMLQSLLQQPARFLVYIAICAIVLYFSIMPFFNFGGTSS